MEESSVRELSAWAVLGLEDWAHGVVGTFELDGAEGGMERVRTGRIVQVFLVDPEGLELPHHEGEAASPHRGEFRTESGRWYRLVGDPGPRHQGSWAEPLAEVLANLESRAAAADVSSSFPDAIASALMGDSAGELEETAPDPPKPGQFKLITDWVIIYSPFLAPELRSHVVVGRCDGHQIRTSEIVEVHPDTPGGARGRDFQTHSGSLYRLSGEPGELQGAAQPPAVNRPLADVESDLALQARLAAGSGAPGAVGPAQGRTPGAWRDVPEDAVAVAEQTLAGAGELECIVAATVAALDILRIPLGEPEDRLEVLVEEVQLARLRNVSADIILAKCEVDDGPLDRRVSTLAVRCVQAEGLLAGLRVVESTRALDRVGAPPGPFTDRMAWCLERWEAERTEHRGQLERSAAELDSLRDECAQKADPEPDPDPDPTCAVCGAVGPTTATDVGLGAGGPRAHIEVCERCLEED